MGDQQDVKGPQDCIQPVIGDDIKASDVSIDSQSEAEDNVIHGQQVQRVQEPMGYPHFMCAWAKSLLV